MKHEIHIPFATRLPRLANPPRRHSLGKLTLTLGRRIRDLSLDTEAILFALCAVAGTAITAALMLSLIISPI